MGNFPKCPECGGKGVKHLGEEDPSRSRVAASVAGPHEKVPVNNFHRYECENGHEFSWSDPAS